jgi:hypothetical protein
MNIEEKIDNFQRKYAEGFTPEEFEALVNEFPGINLDKVNDAMLGNTCPIVDGIMVYYPWDVRSAIYCGVENRNQRDSEWD